MDAKDPTALDAPALTREARVRDLVATHFDRIWQSLRRLGLPPDAADDAAQEVFAVAARRIDSLEPGGERQYLYGIAHRVASQARRTRLRRREEPGVEIDILEATSCDQEELLDQKRARERLNAVLEAMPFDLRAPFVFFELDGLTVPEIARALDLPAGTAASRLRRAREAFRELVAEAIGPGSPTSSGRRSTGSQP
jgi:RNA polymerase sigma-70 factor, ECF subfamily